MKHLLLYFLIVGSAALVRAGKQNGVEMAFRKIGTYREPHSDTEKTYYVPRLFRAQWQYTRAICRSYDLDIVSLETLDEVNSVIRMCESNKDLFNTWFVHIGAMTHTGRSTDDWYWVNTGEKISYSIPWRNGQPDYYGNAEYCMSLVAVDKFKFNDIACYGVWEEKFICQSVSTISDNSFDPRSYGY